MPQSLTSEARPAQMLLSVEAIRPGMVLAEEVRDRRGRLLALDGTLLTRRHQRQMRLWGIEIVAVVTQSMGLALPPLPTKIEENAPIESLATDERDPFMMELLQQVREGRK